MILNLTSLKILKVFGWVLGSEPGQGIVPTAKDIEFSKYCIKTWTDFAKTGKCPWNPYSTNEEVQILTTADPIYDNSEAEKVDIFKKSFFEQI